MMPQLTTPIPVPKTPFRVDFSTGIVCLGSCFADEVGGRLQMADFHVEVNPYGPLYNPASVASALRRLVEDREVDESDLVQHEGLWHSWHHHGRFSRPSAEECLAACNERIHQAHRALGEASLLIITFGSAWIFEREGQVVANCHKLPSAEFVRRRMSVEEVVALWKPLLETLQVYYPMLNILFTVSPIRHMADGAHGNQLSKSTLLLAIDQLITHSPKLKTLSYFPAYEIVLDELRDYRFYDADMAHPSSLAVDVVWERFQRATMVAAVQQQAHFNAKQHRREQHIPLHPTADNAT